MAARIKRCSNCDIELDGTERYSCMCDECAGVPDAERRPKNLVLREWRVIPRDLSYYTVEAESLNVEHGTLIFLRNGRVIYAVKDWNSVYELDEDE